MGRVFFTGTGADADDAIADDIHAEGGELAQDGSQESFFGMRSEAAVLTGAALGPGLRRAAKVCLGVILVFGVVFWAAATLFLAYSVFGQGRHTNPDMPGLPDGRPWTAFYLVGALWAVGVGVFGLAAVRNGARLVWCLSCVATAFIWPLGLAASAAVVAGRRPGLAVSRRVALVALAGLVLVGGSVWGFTAPAGGPQPIAVGSGGDLLGTWRSHSGMSVELRGDGTYVASALSGEGLGDGEEVVPASSGLWDSEDTGGGYSGVRLQIDGDLANSLWFEVYRAGPDLVLCSEVDPDEPCQVALRRF